MKRKDIDHEQLQKPPRRRSIPPLPGDGGGTWQGRQRLRPVTETEETEMKVGLHDEEKEHFRKPKTFPNLALMKISAWH